MALERVFVSIDPELANTLVLELSSHSIRETLADYAALIERATDEVGKLFDRAEWNYFASVLNGTLIDSHWTAGYLLANVSDGHSLDSEGYRWFGDEPAEIEAKIGSQKSPEVERRVKEFCRKIGELTPLQVRAVLLACRHFWNHEGIDHQHEVWWTMSHRKSFQGEKS